MLTVFSANRILTALIGRGSSATLGSTAYVGLSKTPPNPDGTGFIEPQSDRGYARVLLGVSGTAATYKMKAPADGKVENGEIIFFPEAIDSWDTLTYFGIFDAATNGNLLAYGELTTPITPVANTVPIVRVGDLDLSIV